MTTLEKMKLTLGIQTSDEDQLLMMYLDQAHEYILAYTRRQTLPNTLNETLVRIAVELYRKHSLEGAISASVGSSRLTFATLSPDIMKVLKAHRLAKVLQMRKQRDSDGGESL